MTSSDNWRTRGIKWSGDVYGPNLVDHLHAIGVVAANYNNLEFAFLCLFGHYFGYYSKAQILFQQFRNNFRLDTFKCLIDVRENDPTVKQDTLYFCLCYEICAENRNNLMHSQIDSIGKDDTSITLKKTSQKNPQIHIYAEMKLEDIRGIADEIMAIEHYAQDLFIWLNARERKLTAGFAGLPLPTYPQRPSEPKRRNLSPRNIPQE